MNLNWKPFYLIQKEMLVFSFSITYVCFLIFVKQCLFEHLFFIYLNCFLRTIFVRIIIFILSYYAVSLSYPYPGFLKFAMSPCPVVSYLHGRIRVRAS